MTPTLQQDIETLQQESTKIVEQAKQFCITTQEQYEKAAGFLVTIKQMQKEIKATFDPIVEKAHAAHKEATTQRKKHLDPLIEAEEIVKRESLTFYREQERIRLEEERKAQERAAAEERRKKEELEARAQKWEGKGNEDKAEEIREQAAQVYVAPKPVAPTFQKTHGQAIKEVWKVEIVDMKAFITGIAQGSASVEFVDPNMSALNRFANATKGTMQILGCRIVKENILAVKA